MTKIIAEFEFKMLDTSEKDLNIITVIQKTAIQKMTQAPTEVLVNKLIYFYERIRFIK